VILKAGENVLKIHVENIKRARLKGRDTDLRQGMNEASIELLLLEVSNFERLGGGHPGIIQPIRADEHGILLPRYRRGNLREFMRVNENQPLDTALSWVHDIADAMCFCHSRGIMWDDVHPQNILGDGDDDQLVLIDFANSPWY